MDSKVAEEVMLTDCNGGQGSGQPGGSWDSGLWHTCRRSTRLRNEVFLEP